MAEILNISTPEMIQQLLNDLSLPAAEKKKLNRELSNDTRRFFRNQINSQKDIEGNAYAPRKRRNVQIGDNSKARVNRNMLTGLSRMLIAKSDESGFSVGLAGLAGQIAKTHNEGKTVTYTRRMNGWFNSKKNKWEGGIKRKAAYRMPKRTMIGWTERLERQIAHKILQRMEPKK